MSNKKLENALKALKSSKTGAIILKAWAHRERDIRGTKDATGCPQYTMEIARLRTDIFNDGVKDGRTVVVPKKTELDDAKFYEFFEKLAECGALEVVKRGKENQILIVNFNYSVKDMGRFALGTLEGELRTCSERDKANSEARAQHVANAKAAKAGVAVSRQGGMQAPSAKASGTVMGQSGGGIEGKIQQAIASKIEDAISKALDKAFGNL